MMRPERLRFCPFKHFFPPRRAFLFLSIDLALRAIRLQVLCFMVGRERPLQEERLLPHCLARTQAAYKPFLLILQVPFAQTGKLFFGPKKHFFPHFLFITVLARPFGEILDHPAHGTALRLFLLRVFLGIIYYLNIIKKNKEDIYNARVFY